MLFSEALAELEKGNYVTRCAWKDGSYLAFLPHMEFLWKVQLVPNVGAGNWLPMVQDYKADDWKLLSKSDAPCAPPVEVPPAADVPDAA